MPKKTILITGASRGLGQQLAHRYASADVNLILIARDMKRLAEVATICQYLGATTLTQSIDVRNAAEMKQFILEADDSMPIDLVIANAGVASTLQPGWQAEKEEDVHHVMTCNVQGAMNTINPLVDRMIARKSGQIVLMSSLAGLRGLPQSPSYCASKAAVLVYGQSLRAWLSRYQIHVNVVCPGYVITDMSERLTGPKPFLISAEKAARIIQKGLEKNKAIVAFPWQLNALTKLAAFLPTKPVNAILNRFESYAVDKT